MASTPLRNSTHVIDPDAQDAIAMTRTYKDTQYPGQSQPPFIAYSSRRSVVHSTHAIVSCTQPLAAQAGLRILKEGGNAADAAVAVAACLNVLEPASTGIGGDLFCLYYNSSTNEILALNASGRSPSSLTLERALQDIPLEKRKNNHIPTTSAHAVTIPGAAAGWVDVQEQFGSKKLSLKQILTPAIELAEEGFPVSELSAGFWKNGENLLKTASPNGHEMLKDGKRAPGPGELMTLETLAQTFRDLAEHGKKGFYEGRIAEAIVEAVQNRDGVLTLEDLERHGESESDNMRPISLEVPWGEDQNGKRRIWECSPNSQGIIALMALGILRQLETRGAIPRLGKQGEYLHNSAEYLHAVIEALRIAFADGHWYVREPAMGVPVDGLLSKEYLSKRSELFSPHKRNRNIHHGTPYPSPALQSCDTVYFSVVDDHGNGISFINSTYTRFGTGIIPAGCGFTLQSRGSGFSLLPDHPNVLEPNKRPYHTIIPALLTYNKSGINYLDTVFGVMGGYMQPQGHVQVLLNMLAYNMDPQRALDAPRINIGLNYDPTCDIVHVEEGVSGEAIEGLKRLGHTVEVVDGYHRGIFGRGQIVRVEWDDKEETFGVPRRKILHAGSDMRGDGHAVGY